MYDELTIAAYHRALRERTTTVTETVAAYLDRIAQHRDGRGLNAVVTVNPHALDEARACDRAGASQRASGLLGVPVLIKDQAETAGIVTTFGSRLFADYIPAEDATVVRRLREAGAIILGKTTMCDLAAGWFSSSSHSGHTASAYDPERDSGGSSAGSGAAVGANLCLVAVGEDTGGSIRIPASFNNAFGLRVTTGLIPRTGFSPLVHFQDTAGPMARTVADLAALLDVLAGYDPADPFTAVSVCSPDLGHFGEAAADGTELDQWSFAPIEEAFGVGEDAAPVNAVVRAALDRLTEAGSVARTAPPLTDLGEWIAQTSVYGKVSKRDLTRFFAARPGPVGSFDEIYASGVFHPENDLFSAMAEAPEDPDDDPEYLRMRIAQGAFQREVLARFAATDADFLVCPTVQVLPPTHRDLADGRYTALTFPTNTVIASQAGLPALSAPVGFTDEGIPVGLEVIARPYREADLLRFAAGLERLLEPRHAPQAVAAALVGSISR